MGLVGEAAARLLQIVAVLYGEGFRPLIAGEEVGIKALVQLMVGRRMDSEVRGCYRDK